MSEIRNSPAPSATTDMPQSAEPVGAAVPAVVQEPTPVATPVAPSVPSVPSVPAPTGSEPPEPIRRRFGELAAQRREADARAERLERLAQDQSKQIETLLSRLTAPTPVPVPPGSDGVLPRPVRDSFSDNESFETALVSWAGDQAASRAASELRRVQEETEAARVEREREASEAQERAAREAEENKRSDEMRVSWETRRAKALELHPDFPDVAEASSLPISVAMGHVIVTHENGPEIAYYLGKNPGEAARIAGLVVPGQVFPAGHPQAGLPIPNAVAQAFELGRIAARLGTPEPATVLTTEPIVPAPAPVPAPSPSIVVLPAPPEPISGASARATQRDPASMTMDEYAAHRAPQLLAERRPGRGFTH